MRVRWVILSGVLLLFLAAIGGLVHRGWPLVRRFQQQELEHRLVSAAANGHVWGVRRHLDEGVDPNSRDWQGMRALYWAASGGFLPIVRELVRCGADVERLSWVGGTPLMAATKKGHTPVVRYLLQAGADPGRVVDGQSALSLAREKGHRACAALLEQQIRRRSHLKGSGRSSAAPGT